MRFNIPYVSWGIWFSKISDGWYETTDKFLIMFSVLLEIWDFDSTDGWNVSVTLLLLSNNYSSFDLFLNPLLNDEKNGVSQEFNQFKKLKYS